VDYQLTVVRSQQSVDDRALADYRWAQGSGETTSRHALPNIRVEVVRDACRQMTHFFTDLIIGRRHSETRTERVPYSHSEWVTVPFEGHVDYRPRGAALASATALLVAAYTALTSSGLALAVVPPACLALSAWAANVAKVRVDYSGTTSREVQFTGHVETDVATVYLIDPLLDEKLDLRSDTISKVYVSPVPSTLPLGD
jgi:hypothetical protein